MSSILDEAIEVVQNRLDEKTKIYPVPQHLETYTVFYAHPFNVSKMSTDVSPKTPEVEKFTVFLDENGEFPSIYLPDGTVVILERQP